jgi:hypothetical protein
MPRLAKLAFPLSRQSGAFEISAAVISGHSKQASQGKPEHEDQREQTQTALRKKELAKI